MVKWEDQDTFEDEELANKARAATKVKNETDRTDTGSVYDGASSVGSDSGFDDSQIGGRETAQVTTLRVAVMLVLLLAAAGVSATVFYLTKKAETKEFESEYDAVAAKVLETFEDIVSEKLSALSAFSISATAYARAKNESFPFVTMQDYQQTAGSIREVVDCLLVYSIYHVEQELRADWETYSNANTDWYYEDMAYQRENGINFGGDYPFSPALFRYEYNMTTGGFDPTYEDSPGPYAPIWQASPLFPSFPNFNVYSFPPYAPVVSAAVETGKMAIGRILTATPGDSTSPDLSTVLYAILLGAKAGKPTTYDGSPMAYTALPIYDSFDVAQRKAVGTISAIMSWSVYFQGVVPPKSKPVILVLENACDGPHSYEVDNENVEYLGVGDLHDTNYGEFERKANLNALLSSKNAARVYNVFELEELECPYSIRVYPTKAMEDDNRTSIPFITTFAIAGVFLFTLAVFWVYNTLVERRQQLVLTQATQSTDLVASFLPAEVQKRLLHEDRSSGENGQHMSATSRLRNFLSEGSMTEKPLADLFPFCTVLIADIAGFTSWSSTRDPSHVFTLLQTLYKSFDELAKKHKVFKVETIGDSYVAVTGMPTEQVMHPVLMAKFAWAILQKMRSIVKDLVRSLGPDTSDLALRIGLHSGPVTAGVLKGERPRLQLFGDTVNTADRMQSTCIPNRIHLSYATATQIEKLGKGKWITKRADQVTTKGFGSLETYWLNPEPEKASSEEEDATATHNRLVDWVAETLLDKLRKIVALRRGLAVSQSVSDADLVYKLQKGRTCMDEVRETMSLPPFDPNAAAILASVKPHEIDIQPAVVQQLRDFVSTLSTLYRPNHFHGWEHACHVTLATDKFLNRIMDSDGDNRTLHEYTHGLTSDPLMLMGIVLSAVIHDADHQGVSNMQLAKEDPQMAERYKDKSIAEQHSLDIAWEVLMKPDFALLRRAMFTDRKEMLRFRQVIVNIVLATDIFDKELNAMRKARWDKAFSESSAVTENNLRATIVIEHIIQASDVSHTMQHWHIYVKWNKCLFFEMSKAFKEGRMGKDPAEFWYNGELGFFDNYIIPLAKKLKECNVFGVSSDEMLNFAESNKREWEQRGKEIVAGYLRERDGVAAPADPLHTVAPGSEVDV